MLSRGLGLHSSKCKAQTNVSGWSTRGEVRIEDGLVLKVLPEGEGLEILGTVLALSDATRIEIEHRIAAGWRSFWSLKRLLLNCKTSVKKRLRLFDATVGSSVLWCCQSWTPRVDEMRLLQTARNGMLRRICGSGRVPDEPWVEWIQRTTRRARGLAENAGVREWVHAHAAMKWSWAGHVLRRPVDSWVWKVTTWRDSAWNDIALECGSFRPLRPSRRRWMKWEDNLRRFSASQELGVWTDVTSDRETWASWRDAFADWFAAKCAESYKAPTFLRLTNGDPERMQKHQRVAERRKLKYDVNAIGRAMSCAS